MKVKTVSSICRSVCIFNLTADMRKYIIKTVLCAVLLGVFAIGYSQAGTWSDDFSGAELNGWERIFEEDPWSVDWRLVAWGPMDDHFLLFGDIRMPKQEGVTAADFLHWNAHPFQLDKLKVVGDEIRYGRPASGELCLFLGKRQPEPDFAEGYIFSPEKATKMQFTENGVYNKGEVKAEYAPMFRLTSGDLKVFFDTGTFQIFTQDLFITEFFDAEITMIDVIGLMIVFEFPVADVRWFDGSISTFSVSGEGIPNHNSLDVPLGNMQLTTTWGELKRF